MTSNSTVNKAGHGRQSKHNSTDCWHQQPNQITPYQGRHLSTYTHESSTKLTSNPFRCQWKHASHCCQSAHTRSVCTKTNNKRHTSFFLLPAKSTVTSQKVLQLQHYSSHHINNHFQFLVTEQLTEKQFFLPTIKYMVPILSVIGLIAYLSHSGVESQ